jgi:alkylation response protein AidB-like acyl-CoA dehydrogenase
MTFLLSEEQRAIQKTARDLCRERLPVAHLRAVRDSAEPERLIRAAWRQLADLGFAGILVPEEHGGAGQGLAELGLILEECGRTLAPTPLLSTAMLGASAITLGGTDAQRAALLPAVAGGELLLALAHQEGRHHAPYQVATTAARVEGGFGIRGAKRFVLDGELADRFVVVARTAGAPGERDGLTLLLVPAGAAGVRVTPLRLVDSRAAARVTFDDVTVGSGAVLGAVDRGADLLDPLLDRAAAALSAEMLGGAREAFERTVEYLKVRKQFGAPIGSFQALQHRAAHMFCELELCRSVVAEALRALDQGRSDAPLLASAAKARLSDAYPHITAEAIQLHGGIGVTDECDIGLFYKRATVAAMTLGGAAYHRDRFGRLQGY